MPRVRDSLPERVKAVEREFVAMRYAVQYLQTVLKNDSKIDDSRLRVRDFRDSEQRLQHTYVIRLFVAFEAGLRNVWRAMRQNDPPSRAHDLLEATATTYRIPFDVLHNAHCVREFRNTLVHNPDDGLDSMSIAQARSYLCIFLSFIRS
jgi:hypothetical protein